MFTRLLSAYDLLTNGYVPKGTYNQADVDALLSQAKTLGDKLLVQFETPSGLPTANINFTTNEPINGQFTDPLNNVTYNATNVAVAGTLVLEFHRLSDLTGDLKYRLAVSNLVCLLQGISIILTLPGRSLQCKLDFPTSCSSLPRIDWFRMRRRNRKLPDFRFRLEGWH
jgi:hypothetical protein